MDNTPVNTQLNRRQFLTATLSGTVLLASGLMGVTPVLHADAQPPDLSPFKLPPLPYGNDALSPYISANTIKFHYGKHHQGYIDKINSFIQNTEFAKYSLEEIIKKTATIKDHIAIFNNAAQAWNHGFYWKSMKPEGGGAPTGALAKKLDADFGSLEKFKKAFGDAAATQFGSGWAWLVADRGNLAVVKTSNADTPLAHGQVPILTIDVWEHAYYLDYQNRRTDYIAAFLDHLVNWDFAEKNFTGI
ncbi:superoxide dismutase [Desulfobacterium sp. N47]|uniref:Superoxide dismutase n=1 Tax=uncultured Desulfobacterium sp. TaxID=201089 RepID=E1YMH5_9BACT|nr:Superoxide dismutase [Fe] [uncultured Desulfobacterium sp.]